MGKSVDIDALLGDEKLELTIKGRKFYVEDVSLELFLTMINAEESDKNDREYVHKILAQLLDVEVDEIKDIGFKAASLTLVEVTKWVMQAAAEGQRASVELEELAAEPKNP